VTYTRVQDWMIGFTDTLYTPLGTTGNYRVIANLRTLQFTVTHALSFSIFSSRILAKDVRITVSLLTSVHRLNLVCTAQFLSCHYSATANCEDSTQFNSSDPKHISWQTGVSKLTLFLSTELFFITTLHGPRRKHSLYIVVRACLQIRCTAKEVTRLLLAYSLRWECVYQVVA
jgi:hypothetical protein